MNIDFNPDVPKYTVIYDNKEPQDKLYQVISRKALTKAMA